MNTDEERFKGVINLLSERFVDDFVCYHLWNGRYPTETSSILDQHNQIKDELLNQFLNPRINNAYGEFNTAFDKLYHFLIKHFWIPKDHYTMHDSPPFYYLDPQYHHNFYMSEGGQGLKISDAERSKIWNEHKKTLDDLANNFQKSYKKFVLVARKKLEMQNPWFKTHSTWILISAIITIIVGLGNFLGIVPISLNEDPLQISVSDVQY